MSTPSVPAPRAASSVAARAALVAALLVLFYVLAAAIVVGLVAASIAAFTNGAGSITGKLAFVAVVVGLALGRAVFAVEKSSHEDLPGRAVSRSEEPHLWQLVDEVAQEVGTRSPEELRLVDDVNAFVTQDARLLGLLDGRRTLAVGLALLQCVSVPELRAVLAHEFGHYTGGDTRLGPLTYRATVTVRRAVDNLGPRSLLGRLFGLYAVLVYRTSLAVRRRQEVSADLTAARLVGPGTTADALRSVHAGATAYEFFLDRYVTPLLEHDVRPANLYAGFAALLDDPDRQEQLAALREDDDAAPADRYDSHPSLGQRLAALAAAPVGDATAPATTDERWAIELLSDPDDAGRRATDDLLGHLQGLTTVEEFEDAVEAYTAGPLKAGAALLAAVADVDGGPRPGTLGRALDLVAAGRGTELVVALTRDRRQAEDPARDVADTLSVPLAALACQQLVDAGKASYSLSWAGPVQLRTAKGAVLELADEAHAALLQPDTVPALRRSWSRRGIALDAPAALPPQLADAADGDRDDIQLIVPGITMTGQRGARADLLFTHEALLVAQYATKTSRVKAMARAYREAGEEDQLLEQAQARLAPLADASPAQIAAMDGVTRYAWDALDRVVLAGGGRSGRTYALGVVTDKDATPVTYTAADDPVHRDEVLEQLAIALGGDRVYVTD